MCNKCNNFSICLQFVNLINLFSHKLCGVRPILQTCSYKTTVNVITSEYAMISSRQFACFRLSKHCRVLFFICATTHVPSLSSILKSQSESIGYMDQLKQNNRELLLHTIGTFRPVTLIGEETVRSLPNAIAWSCVVIFFRLCSPKERYPPIFFFENLHKKMKIWYSAH